ncbi:MAG: iron-sulfur cluster repair di-iron protein [Balneolales bacterium]
MHNLESVFATQKVGDIVAENYHSAGVFREFGIDFCCGGGITLKEACEQNHLDLDQVTGKLKQTSGSMASDSSNFNEWDPDLLIDYIEKSHHRFVRRKTTEIAAYAEKVARVHGHRHPENVEIFQSFIRLSRELLEHLQEEENTVFPLIRRFFNRFSDNGNPDDQLKTELRNELAKMVDDHQGAGELMAHIRELSNSFTPPPDACTTYQVLYQNLAGFEQDLHKHVHLENNILFRKAGVLLN